MQLKIIQLTEKLWQDCLFKDIYGYFLNGTIIDCISFSKLLMLHGKEALGVIFGGEPCSSYQQTKSQL